MRGELSEKHCEEKLELTEKEEEDRVYIMQRLLRHYMPDDKSLRNELTSKLNMKNKDELQKKIADVKEEKKNEIQELKKKLFQENEEELNRLKKQAEFELKHEEV